MSRITDIAQEMKTWWSNEGSDIQVQSALDEIIRIDQERAEQTEPQTEVETMSCEECKWYIVGEPCKPFIEELDCHYEPKDEPQTEK